MREDGIVVVDVDDVDDDGGGSGVGPERRIAAVVSSHDHQMIRLFDFAIERKTTQNAGRRFDPEFVADVSARDRVRNTTVFALEGRETFLS